VSWQATIWMPRVTVTATLPHVTVAPPLVGPAAHWCNSNEFVMAVGCVWVRQQLSCKWDGGDLGAL